MTRPAEWWVAPPFDGPPTGGTVYNARLTGAVRELGIACERVDVARALSALESGAESGFWVDSLHLDALPELRRANVHSRPLRLVVHYLPSLVEKGIVASAEDLTSTERAALSAADECLATSDWLGAVLARVGVPPDRIKVVEPGVDVPLEAPRVEPARVSDERPLRAVIVANVVPGKGIAPFLTALSRVPRFPLDLCVIGSVEHDVSYARACTGAALAEPALSGRVRFAGSLPHADVLGLIAQSDVLVSASRMESFGMALAEARALGVPILSRRAGNAAALVDEAAGGFLFDDDATLADALATLAGAPDELADRTRNARDVRRRRTWKSAAADFVRLLR